MLSNAVLLGLLLMRQLVVYAVKCCATRVITEKKSVCVSCQTLCLQCYYWRDTCLCMLSNPVLLGLLLRRQLVVYVVKCCAHRVITGETMGRVCCQMLCSYSSYWGDSWLCILSNAVLLGLLLGRQLFGYAGKCCAPRVITNEKIG